MQGQTKSLGAAIHQPTAEEVLSYTQRVLQILHDKCEEVELKIAQAEGALESLKLEKQNLVELSLTVQKLVQQYLREGRHA